MNPKMFNGLNINTIVNGANKILGFANQAIPLYKNLKPFFDNSKSIMSILNIMKEDNNNVKVKEDNKKESTNGLPTFFQ